MIQKNTNTESDDQIYRGHYTLHFYSIPELCSVPLDIDITFEAEWFPAEPQDGYPDAGWVVSDLDIDRVIDVIPLPIGEFRPSPKLVREQLLDEPWYAEPKERTLVLIRRKAIVYEIEQMLKCINLDKEGNAT